MKVNQFAAQSKQPSGKRQSNSAARPTVIDLVTIAFKKMVDPQMIIGIGMLRSGLSLCNFLCSLWITKQQGKSKNAKVKASNYGIFIRPLRRITIAELLTGVFKQL